MKTLLEKSIFCFIVSAHFMLTTTASAMQQRDDLFKQTLSRWECRTWRSHEIGRIEGKIEDLRFKMTTATSEKRKISAKIKAKNDTLLRLNNRTVSDNISFFFALSPMQQTGDYSFNEKLSRLEHESFLQNKICRYEEKIEDLRSRMTTATSKKREIGAKITAKSDELCELKNLLKEIRTY